MNDKNAELVSSLMDGELDEHTADEVIGRLENHPEERNLWMRYHFISDVMNGHGSVRVDKGFADRVSEAVSGEPTILVPRIKSVSAMMKKAGGLAVAASVALLAVLVVQKDIAIDGGEQQVAITSPVAGEEWIRVDDGINWRTSKPAVESKLNSYLVNHNGYTSGMRGILPYTPIVSYDSPGEKQPDNDAPIEYQEASKK